ncbi:site-specific integrase [Hymenobacter cellulosivorans]|uniref:Site-specific integrase n=1 Tax=Hymenobacter cellulosivorans TaxID=2932249 RepID=A0ABY4F8W4_9BACT|nr:site-specific integrase [Hymenobacter cellulosivorans]UOQ53091.1 site-specific integrase [Hymenobacter cellulosivorans]
MTIRFYLHSKVYANSSKRAIYLEIRFPEHPAAFRSETLVLRKSTGKKCDPAHFTDKQRVKKDPKAHDINSHLNKLEQWAGEVVDQAKLHKDQLTPELLWERMLARDDARPTPAPVPVAAVGPPTIEAVAAEWKQFYKAKHSDNYLRKVDPIVTHWETFRPGATLEDILPDPKTRRSAFVEEWCEYLIEEAPRRDGGIGLESNTVGRYVQALRQLLKFAGHPYAWLTDEYTYEVEIEPLRFEEVMQLYEAPMPTEHLAHIRDIFVFGCFTGPRYGNLRSMQPSDVVFDHGDYILEYVQHKGRRKKTKVRVALDEVALEIWQRYEGNLRVPANTEINTSIKLAAKAAGLDRPILQVRMRGPHRIERRGPYWEFITCHVARHTFGTLLLDGNADLGQVQNSMGHSAIQTTRRYAKSREPKRHAATKTAFQNLRATHTDASGV